MLEQPYITLDDNMKRKICLQRINELETERYLHELEAIACTRIADQKGAVLAQEHSERLAGKVVALVDQYNSTIPQEEASEGNGEEVVDLKTDGEEEAPSENVNERGSHGRSN